MADDATLELRAAIDARVRAIRARDLEAVVAFYAPEVVAFDVVAPLVNRGVEALRERLAAWFGSFQSGFDYGLREPALTLSGDVAFDHHLVHVRGRNAQGEVDMVFRETVGYRRLDGRWRIVHQHSSVPFEPATGRALLGPDAGS